MKITKNNFLMGFCVATLLLAAVRYFFPSIAYNYIDNSNTEPDALTAEAVASVKTDNETAVSSVATGNVTTSSRFFNADGSVARHRIYSVPGYDVSFPR